MLDFYADLNSYQYDLPESLIAKRPAEPRDSSRLLVIHRKEGRWEHRHFKNLPDYINSRDLVVLNNTQVLKARFRGNRVKLETRGQELGASSLGGRVEFVLLENKGTPYLWEGLIKASARALPGVEFQIQTPDGKGLRGKIIHGSNESPSGTVVVEFNRDPVESGAGEIPLPHYMSREAEASDDTEYQTVYAKELGSAAAPTAGLHFTGDILERMKAKGARLEEVTLHTGLGTFRPVKTQDVRQHTMHEERYFISSQVAGSVTEWKAAGNRVLAIGTTSVRTLESAWESSASGSPRLRCGEQRTSIFIRPGSHQFQVVDRLLTNFHLPGSTLIMLVSAFAGHELIMAAYGDAVQEKYRFFSYGDAMLIL